MSKTEVMNMKRGAAAVLAALLIAAAMLLSSCGGSEYASVYRETGKHLCEGAGDIGVGSVGGEWAVIGLSRSGADVPDGFYDEYLGRADDYVEAAGGVLNTRTGYKYTEYSRMILGVTAAGGDVTDVGGYNLLTKLTDMENVCRQGANGPIWALIAYDSGDYDIPEDSKAEVSTSRDALINAVLSYQLGDGGWDIAQSAGDADMTSMALQALAPYYMEDSPRMGEVKKETLAKVKTAVESGLELISDLQQDNGGYEIMGSDSSESSSQVIVALSALGIDADKDERFVKGDMSALDGLLAFYNEDEKEFYHSLSDPETGMMSTEQAYYALTAYDRFINGESRLYDMTK